MKRAHNWHRDMVRGGESWDDGADQLELLKSRGLRPEHYLLDLACGSFRMGVHAIPYLDIGHYTGLDLRQDIIDHGVEHELEPRGLMQRRPVLVAASDFGESLERKFDFIWAYSLFTHLRPWRIRKCLVTTRAWRLAPGGQFIASYNRAASPEGESMGTEHSEYAHYQMCIYTTARMLQLGESAGLQVEALGARCSGTYAAKTGYQRLLVFTRTVAS